MCDVGSGLAVGGAGLFMQMFGVQQQTAAGNQAADYNANVARQNAQLAQANAGFSDRRAQEAIYEGQQEEKRKRLQIAQTVGAQRAALAGSGVVVDTGTGYDLQEQTLKYGAEDIADIQHNAVMTSWGYQMEAYNKRAEADMFSQEATFETSKKKSSFLPVMTTLLTGGSKLYDKYGAGLFGSGKSNSGKSNKKNFLDDEG